jgi:hypothetical protein
MLINCITLPDIQVPFERKGWNSEPKISSSSNRRPFTRGPSSGGVSRTTEVTIRAKTEEITRTAMIMPFQFRSVTLATTKSCKERKVNKKLDILHKRRRACCLISQVHCLIDVYYSLLFDFSCENGKKKQLD